MSQREVTPQYLIEEIDYAISRGDTAGAAGLIENLADLHELESAEQSETQEPIES